MNIFLKDKAFVSNFGSVIINWRLKRAKPQM